MPLLLVLSAMPTLADDWTQFRGSDGTGASSEKDLPVKWSATDNIVWRTKLPGPGTSSPVLAGGKVFLTSYSGYGTGKAGGAMDNLTYHVLCVDRKTGAIDWDKKIKPNLPEQPYGGYMTRHGYASSTPATDGKHVYCFFGKTGVFCFDLTGNQKWQQSVGTKLHGGGWGTGASPILYKDMVIVNASVESSSLVALNKMTGEKVWTAPNVSNSWSTPVMVSAAEGRKELVLPASGKVLGIDPESGNTLWSANFFKGYVCASVVPHNGVVYVPQRSPGGAASTAVRVGGKGNVTDSHVQWKKSFGSAAASMVYHDGHVYFCSEEGVARCLKAATGEEVYKKALSPKSGIVYASPLLADGKIYYVSQENGTYVVAATPEFKQLAHNVFADDSSRTNASPIADGGCIVMRTDQYLYCIGKK